MAMQRLEFADKTFHFKPNNRFGQVNEVFGYLWAYLRSVDPSEPSQWVYTLFLNPEEDTPKDFEKALFVLDDGYDVKMYYVAGYSPGKEQLFIHPVSAGQTQYLGPKTTYFLSVTNKDK